MSLMNCQLKRVIARPLITNVARCMSDQVSIYHFNELSSDVVKLLHE